MMPFFLQPHTHTLPRLVSTTLTDHGKIGTREFAHGLMKAVVLKPNGSVAEWILKELQDEAAEWTEHSQPETQRIFFSHETDGKQQREKPEILIEMERCKALAAGGGKSGEASKTRGASRRKMARTVSASAFC
jgi:hypothetical protein